MLVKTNLRVLKPSRKKPQPGDLFAMGLPDGDFLFGRVIGADVPEERAPMPGSYLVYVYRDVSPTKNPGPPERWRNTLNPDRLLMPPVYINRMPWTRGYFETVGHRELDAADMLKRHCFRGYRDIYYDEQGRRLSRRSEPCGEWALISYRMLDDLVSEALGIPLVD